MQNDRSGLLFRPKTDNPKAPAWQGKLTIPEAALAHIKEQLRNGAAEVQIDLSAWEKDGQKGPFLATSMRPPYKPEDREATPQPKKRRSQPERNPELDDEIPF